MVLVDFYHLVNGSKALLSHGSMCTLPVAAAAAVQVLPNAREEIFTCRRIQDKTCFPLSVSIKIPLLCDFYLRKLM